MLTKTEAEARVSKGAAHLDVVRPGWFHQIDVGTLTLHDPCGCVLGQLCAIRQHGAAGRIKFGPIAKAFGMQGEENASAHGFAITDKEWQDANRANPYLSYDALCALTHRPLQDAWIAAIAARRHPVSEPVVDGESTVVCLDHERSHVAL